MLPSILAIVGGLVVFLVGLAFAVSVGDQAATAGADAQMGSFASAIAVNNQLPTIFYVGLLIGGLGLMLGGGWTAYKKIQK